MAGLTALVVGYMLSQFYRAFLAVLSPSLIADLGATKADLSIASGAWFMAFALSQLFVGVWLDRYGPKRTTGLLLGICGGGGALLFAIATQPWMITLAMVLIGIGCAPVLMAAMFIFAHTWPPARLAVLVSSTMGIGSLGNIIGASPLAAAADAYGWRPVIAALGLMTVAIAATILAFVRDPEQTVKGGGNTGFSGYIELMRLPVLWPILPLVAMNYVPAGGIRGLWAGPYLADVYGLDALAIGHATLFMALAMSIGNFVWGPLDTVFRTRKWVSFTGNSMMLAALVVLALNPAPGVGASTALMVVIGLCGASFGLMMAHGRAFLPPHLTGRGITLLNFFSIGTVGLMQFATGAVVSAATVPGDPAAAYSALYWFYAVAFGLALLIYLGACDAKPG
jgi:sugar phosphate permease